MHDTVVSIFIVIMGSTLEICYMGMVYNIRWLKIECRIFKDGFYIPKFIVFMLTMT